MEATERLTQILSLWLKRPANKRTGNDLLIFYGELQRIRTEVLKHGHGDPYQQLKVDLRGHILEP